MQIKDLTIDEFKALIHETVEDALQDLLVDPDEGKSLKSSFAKQLLAMQEQRLRGETQTLSSSEALQELGLS